MKVSKSRSAVRRGSLVDSTSKVAIIHQSPAESDVINERTSIVECVRESSQPSLLIHNIDIKVLCVLSSFDVK